MEKSKINSLRISCILFFLLFSITGRTQNFSGLQGKELTKIDDTAFALLQFGAKKLDGQIDKVTVIYSGEKTLKLEIHHSGIESTLVSYKITDSGKKPLTQIKNVKYAVIEDKKPLNVEITLKDNLPEGTEIQSSYLQIDVKKEKKNFLPTTFLYSLEKLWKTEINAENLIIPIKLEPIGSAKDLRADNRVFVIPYKKPILRRYPTASTSRYTGTNVRDHRNSTNSANSTSGRANTTDHRNSTSSANSASGRANTTDHRNSTSSTNSASGRANTTDHRTSTSSANSATGRANTTDHRNSTSSTNSASGRANTTDHRNSTSSTRPTPVSGRATVRDHRTTTSNTRTSGSGRTSQTNTSSGKKVLGPDNLNQISLWDNLATDIDFEFPFEITNIQMNIYPDKNLNSGVFYYLPNAYHLQWDTNAGYQFNMLYGTAESSEISGDVSISGVLTPSISKKESDLIKALLNSYIENNKSIYTNKNIDLKIIPIKSTPTISLSEGLQNQYKISEEDINVTISSTINNPINVSWVVDNRIKEEIQVALSEGVGIHGTMVVIPDSETIPEQLIPVRIALADTRTIGKIILSPNSWRDNNWINQTPFPLKLKYIHALVIGKENGRNLPMVYSWSLNNTKVPSQSNVKFNSDLMPKWIESKTERIWIDYSIDECNSCVNRIMDEVTGGTSGSKTKTITFKSFQVLETTEAAFLEVQVRSIQADPKGENVIKLASIIIENDLSEISAGPFYLPESSGLNYEYKLKLVMPDGIIHESDDWITSSEVDVYIGMHTLKETISNLPGF